MRRCLLIFTLLLSCMQSLGAKENAIEQAALLLEKANEQNNQRTAAVAIFNIVDAVEHQCTAGMTSDAALNYCNIPKLIQEQIDRTDQPDVLAMLLLIKADVYTRIYNAADAHKELLPPGINRWSRDEFSREVSDCYSRVLSLTADRKYKLSDWPGVISADRGTLKVFPTISSFAALQAVDNPLLSDTERYNCIRAMIRQSKRSDYPLYYWKCRQIQFETADNPTRRIERLDSLYTTDKEVNAALIALEQFVELTDGKAEYNTLPWANRLGAAIVKHLEYPGRARLKAMLERSLEPSVSIEVPNRVAAGHEQPIPAKLNNYMRNACIVVGKAQCADSALNLGSHSAVFAQTPVSTQFTPSTPGRYSLQPVVDADIKTVQPYIDIHATTITPTVVNTDGTRAVIVSDSWDGTPLEGMHVIAYDPEGEPIDMEYIGKTNQGGVVFVDGPLELASQPRPDGSRRTLRMAVVSQLDPSALSPALLQLASEAENYDMVYCQPGTPSACQADSAADQTVSQLISADCGSMQRVSFELPIPLPATMLVMTALEGDPTTKLQISAVAPDNGRLHADLQMPDRPGTVQVVIRVVHNGRVVTERALIQVGSDGQAATLPQPPYALQLISPEWQKVNTYASQKAAVDCEPWYRQPVFRSSYLQPKH